MEVGFLVSAAIVSNMLVFLPYMGGGLNTHLLEETFSIFPSSTIWNTLMGFLVDNKATITAIKFFTFIWWTRLWKVP